jgi:hypothetical protein
MNGKTKRQKEAPTFTTHPVKGATGFPGFVGIAIKKPFKGVLLAGLMRDPMIRRWVWGSEPLLIRRYLFT